MANSLDELIATSSDSDLCHEVARRIDRRYPRNASALDYSEEERVVQLVILTWGAIGNGGFNYLFEASIPGDSHYKWAAEAYEAIDCQPAGEAFRDALALFPASKPPVDAEERIRHFRGGPGVQRREIERRFFRANDDIERCLAAYIRSHSEAFRHLDDPAPPRPKAKRKNSLNDGSEKRGFDLSQVPHWDRVAFAAKCARRVLPLFAKNWPEAPPEFENVPARAVELTEKSVAERRPAEGLREAIMEAGQAAGSAIMGLYGYPEELITPIDDNVAELVSTVANAARHAADAALAAPANSEYPAGTAWGFTKSALESIGDRAALIELWTEYETLRDRAESVRWVASTTESPTALDAVDEDETEERKPWWKFWK